jgi:hypothetical protein
MIDNDEMNSAIEDINRSVSFVLINGSKEQTDFILNVLYKSVVFTLNRYNSPEIMMLEVFNDMVLQLKEIQESGKLQNVVKESKHAIKH